MLKINKSDFLSYLKYNCNINLTKEQEEIVFNVYGPMAVVAVPGAGKTATLISRTANLILNQNVNPKRILGLSFSKASAIDMRNRFKSFFGNIIKDTVPFSTIHSFAYYVINNYSFRRNKKYTIIESKDSPVNRIVLLKNIYTKYNNDFINDDKLEELSSFIGYLKNIMVSFENTEIYKEDFPVPNFINIYREYELYKKKNNLLDYDDMLVKCYKILHKDKEILNFYRNLYDYIEVDECQDTSKIQQEIIKLIAKPKFNLCIVGDDDQSIYSWRGAFSQGLLNFKSQYHKDGKIFFMQQNFRSSKQIVNAANEFIKINKKRYSKELFTKNEEGNEINFINVENEYAQIDFLVHKLKQEKDLKETAILFRNNISSITLVDRLIKENISFYIKDSVPSFFNSWVIKDILSFFKLAFDLTDIDAFERIYYKMKSYVKKDDLSILYNRKIKESIFKTLCNNENYFSSSYRLKSFEEKFLKLSCLYGDEAIDFIRYELNYEEYMIDYCEKFKYNMDNIQTILFILTMVLSSCTSLQDIENKLTLLKEEMEMSKSKGKFSGVTLSTMHSSKGLEFDTVYIIDLIEDILPSPDSIDKANKGDKTSLEEETRLMYVAITRGRKNLYLINPLKKNNKKCTPSQFVQKLYNIINKGRSFSILSNNLVKNTTVLNRIPLKVGTLIQHKSFGTGKILTIDEDILTINFGNGLVKNLSYNLCCSKNLINTL
ncbi:DNA helicase-2/ATP-dependent DNA helicase PcrA [Clostridium tetanomorphum]|uniref:DNA 3'-5' helicase n=1 Tax=Clostridium tetanomorphum TaxID=1553 RepID=A0A923J0Y7_CLOTT|nr:ATP-dependent helicase [Clostridium tetanomorphum]KAJ49399.1 DNA helicase II [Clostridium tetanomorphum DSM 665]KAJ50767.1 DNA helicase II [Clostridium tetanomorphum DSM 665]MBC2398592.1 ATP-dependent helicase [Clostridium tetanomorphum]NRS83213.1 DNA helicase-2/ATP-dependent DNA helicase PcrA [Clostridium tetanomorphum]NRZ98687.1 DNA helicase-2/ATP-dependent DNA helicase PcrA [Clostridium tetanomorphum]